MRKQNFKALCDYCKNEIDIKLWELEGNNKRLHHFCNNQCYNLWQKSENRVGFFKGKKHTEESKRKNSLSHKGQKPWITGRKQSEEAKKRMSDSHKLYFVLHPEAREKIRLANIGKKQSKETIQKRISKCIGVKRTPEQRLRISKGHPKGEKCHFWKGGKVSENYRLRREVRYKIWRDSVYQRDNYTCQECREKGGKLTSHHIKSWAKYPELRYDINNGITLCLNCHKKTDSYMNNKS